jgi:hypothetical protein
VKNDSTGWWLAPTTEVISPEVYRATTSTIAAMEQGEKKEKEREENMMRVLKESEKTKEALQHWQDNPWMKEHNLPPPPIRAEGSKIERTGRFDPRKETKPPAEDKQLDRVPEIDESSSWQNAVLNGLDEPNPWSATPLNGLVAKAAPPA